MKKIDTQNQSCTGTVNVLCLGFLVCDQWSALAFLKLRCETELVEEALLIISVLVLPLP